MSEMERHIGRLEKTDKTKEEIVTEWIGKGNEADWDETEEIFLYDIENYIEMNGQIYEIISEQLDECCELCKLIKPQKEPVFVVEFYNGSCCLKEALLDLYQEEER
jgi:hypothetical protein